MKKDFKTIKNFILLIASALTLVAVTFSWFSLSKRVSPGAIDSSVSGSTLAVKYYESKDSGKSYSPLTGDIIMNNMVEGQKAYYKMGVRTFKDKQIKLLMSFEGLSSSNVTARYVYFDYKLTTKNGDVISSGTKLKMSDYSSANVFAADVSVYQKNNINDFELYYDVYVVIDGTTLSEANRTASLGQVKLLGQQVS